MLISIVIAIDLLICHSLMNNEHACQVDYRGYEVTVENFIRVMTGRLPPSTPRSKRLLSDNRSNILIYMTGHGGDGFLKFQVCLHCY